MSKILVNSMLCPVCGLFDVFDNLTEVDTMSPCPKCGFDPKTDDVTSKFNEYNFDVK